MHHNDSHARETDHLAAGYQALADAAWEAGLAQFKAAVRAEESAEAHEGLAMAADLRRDGPLLMLNRGRLEEVMQLQIGLRSLSEGIVFDSNQQILGRAGYSVTVEFDPDLPAWALDRARAGDAVLVVLHDLNLAAAYADRVALLSGGKLVACDVPERVLTAEIVSDVYRTPVEVIPHPGTGTGLVMPLRD